jgi:hypothetical protein
MIDCKIDRCIIGNQSNEHNFVAWDEYICFVLFIIVLKFVYSHTIAIMNISFAYSLM